MSAGSPSSSDISPVRVANTLFSAIKSGLTQQCLDRYDAAVEVRRLRVEQAASRQSLMMVQVVCRGLTQLNGRLHVTCQRGGAYDVLCAVSDGATHRFTYHLPDREPPSRRQLVPLAEDIATFLRGELERRLGQLLLQSPAGPPRSDGASLIG